MGAVRMARTLAGMHGQINGDAALMNGWLGRAKTLLATAPESPERARHSRWSGRTSELPPMAGRRQPTPRSTHRVGLAAWNVAPAVHALLALPGTWTEVAANPMTVALSVVKKTVIL